MSTSLCLLHSSCGFQLFYVSDKFLTKCAARGGVGTVVEVHHNKLAKCAG
jgi:hypothetical protein